MTRSAEPRRDKYLRLMPRCFIHDASPEVFRYAHTVRRVNQWRELGFTVDLNEFGNPERNDQTEYRFFVVEPTDPEIREAIETGKRALRHPLPVFEYVKAGCNLDEFISLPQDVPEYCAGMLLLAQNNVKDALPHLERACALNPNEVRYREAYFPARIALGDLSAIDEELDYLQGDPDTLMHTGRVSGWIHALEATGRAESIDQLLSRLDDAFARLRQGHSQSRHYSKQSPEWYERSHAKFQELARKTRRRLARLKR
ncbi:MAG: hypothetical protein QM750_22095 [Rubrivivax sp.]